MFKKCLHGLFAFLLVTSISSFAKELTLGFDGLADLGTNIDSLGVKFTGATVLACGGSLNCGSFPPSSGRNVIYDSSSSGITATFDVKVGPVTKISAKITGNTNITMTAFDKDGTAIGSQQTGGPNYFGSGGVPNKVLTITTTSARPMVRVTFRDSGNTFTVDDFTFTAEPRVFLVDPGHGQLLDNDGVLRYQRPPTAQYNLREDNLTLQISSATVAKLDQGHREVYMTRSTSKALYDGRCGVYSPTSDSIPLECAEDVKKRAKITEKYELDGDSVVFVSVHTNGGNGRRINGRTQTFYCTDRAKSLSEKLLQKITAVVPPVFSISEGGYQRCGLYVLNNPKGSKTYSGYVEALYHNNADDEDLLNMPSTRQEIGNAIADAMVEFADTIK